MIWVARIAGTLVFLFTFVLGASALINPDRAAETLGFAPLSDMGRNSLRADIAAFAWGSALLSAGGLFAGRPHWFFGAAILFAIAVSGRILDVIVSGPPEGAVPAIVVELIAVALALIAAKWLPSRV
ncbi:MAG: hypothetical protein AAGJ84_08180 [Pseudomonadota bacterium]